MNSVAHLAESLSRWRDVAGWWPVYTKAGTSSSLDITVCISNETLNRSISYMGFISSTLKKQLVMSKKGGINLWAPLYNTIKYKKTRVLEHTISCSIVCVCVEVRCVLCTVTCTNEWYVQWTISKFDHQVTSLIFYFPKTHQTGRRCAWTQTHPENVDYK